MCSELLRIPYVWHGVPIFGFGVLLAIWAVASVVTLAGLAPSWLGRRNLGAVPALLFVAAAIIGLPHLFPAGLPIRGYGLMLLAGIAAGISLAIIRARQNGIDAELILSLAVWLVVCGVIGGRVFFLIEYWPSKVAGKGLGATLIEIVNIPEGGLVVYGALIGATIGFIAFTRKHQLPLLPWADMIAPAWPSAWPWAASAASLTAVVMAAKPLGHGPSRSRSSARATRPTSRATRSDSARPMPIRPRAAKCTAFGWTPAATTR